MGVSLATAAGTWPPLNNGSPAPGDGSGRRGTSAAEAAARKPARIRLRAMREMILLFNGLVAVRKKHSLCPQGLVSNWPVHYMTYGAIWHNSGGLPPRAFPPSVCWVHEIAHSLSLGVEGVELRELPWGDQSRLRV
jgi:hypothetical protein